MNISDHPIIYSTSMSAQAAIERACREPTLVDALSWIAVWESEREMDQRINRLGSGSNGQGWDTCFRHLFTQVLDKYERLTNNPECDTLHT